ncbi:hypothetical protein CASFOL_024433 [Castilleja foliolosa]|uniref:Uncharacterized protein n=1 Tax=Castilleja foliolosa TaxID=1961234 RepID=A0ABD3CQD9_9LAMI
MAEEEYSGGSGGGCRPKKSKQKKAPQRGLGVAQLEKIISEEKQKKGYFGNNIDSDTRAGPFLALHIENSGLSKSWNGEYNIHNNNNNNNLVYEQSNGPILAHQFQRPSSSPLVKYSSKISAMMSTQMEPPSIPIVHFKNYSLTEEDKMIGMTKKRAYPFSLDPIISSSKSDELASFTNHQQQYTLHMPQPSNKLIRENVSNPGGPTRNLNEEPVDNERLNGKFLTLAPPAVASPPLKPVHKHVLDYLGRPSHELISDHQCILGQEYGNKSEIERAGPSFSFFPVEEMRTNRDSAYVIGSGDGETIDLNLKL